MHKPVALLVGALCVLASSEASAHKFSVRRTVMCEAWASTLHVVAKLKVPSGKPKQALLQLADTDLDGRLSKMERLVLENRLIARALDGVKLHVGTATVALDDVKTKLKIDRASDGPVELMLLGQASLPKGSVELGISTGQVGDPLEVRVLPGKRAPTKSIRGPIRRGTLTIELLRGDEVRWTLPASS